MNSTSYGKQFYVAIAASLTTLLLVEIIRALKKPAGTDESILRLKRRL